MRSSRMRTARSSSHRGRVCLSACWDTHTPGCGPGDPPPWVYAWRPPWCGPRDPSRPDPSTSPLGMGLETCKACWDTTPLPPRPAARHAGIPPGDLLQGMLGYHLETCCKACWDTTCNACWDATPCPLWTDRHV